LRTCPGAIQEIENATVFALWALYYLGRWADMGRRIPPLLAEARRRDNLYTATNLTTGNLGVTWLAKDDVVFARESVAQAEKVWARQPGWWHIQHYFIWLAALQLELYEGPAPASSVRLPSGQVLSALSCFASPLCMLRRSTHVRARR